MNPEPTEELEVLPLSPGDVARQIAAGELWDGMTIVSFRPFADRMGTGSASLAEE